MHYTYILYSEKLDKYYIGSTNDLARRVCEHNIGHSKFTSTGMPWILVHIEDFETALLAGRREREIKSKKSRMYIEKLIQNGSASRF